MLQKSNERAGARPCVVTGQSMAVAGEQPACALAQPSIGRRHGGYMLHTALLVAERDRAQIRQHRFRHGDVEDLIKRGQRVYQGERQAKLPG